MIHTKQNLKKLTYKINGAAIDVHRELGPGLLESIYHKCLAHELSLRGLQYFSELTLPVFYKGIVVELKAVEKVLPVHEAQLLTYMKLMSAPLGIMYNFNCTNLYKEGQKTYVNELYRELEEY